MHSDFHNICSKYLINVLYFKEVRKFSTSQQNNIYRVKFSKPNIEISVTVTNASKLQSVGQLYNHKFSSFSSKCSSSFSSTRFSSFWQCFCTEKRVQNQNSQEKDMRTHATTYKSRKNALKIVFLQKNALKIVYSSIRIWFIDFRSIK